MENLSHERNVFIKKIVRDFIMSLKLWDAINAPITLDDFLNIADSYKIRYRILRPRRSIFKRDDGMFIWSMRQR